MFSNFDQETEYSDIVIITEDFNFEVARLNQAEQLLGGFYSISAKWTDNGDRFYSYVQITDYT